MSTQRGNTKKGAQKHKNKFAFKADLHDTTNKMKLIKSITPAGICQRCRDILDWKMKYRKYKPLSQAKTCTKCKQKTVKHAYYMVCDGCAKEQKICGKCGEKTELVGKQEKTVSEQMAAQSQFEAELRMLPERKRRKYLRLQEQGKLDGLSFEELDIEDDDDDSDSDFEDDDSENEQDSDVKDSESAKLETASSENNLETDK